MKFGTHILPLAERAVRCADPVKGKQMLLEAVRTQAQEHNLDYIELHPGYLCLNPDIFDSKHYNDMGRIAEEVGLGWTVHLPHESVDVNLSATNELVRRAGVAATLEAVSATSRLEPSLYILHVVNEKAIAARTLDTSDNSWPIERALKRARVSLHEIIGPVPPEKVCIENLPNVPAELTTSLAEEFDTGLCLDIGHLVMNHEDIDRFLDRNGQRIRTIHLHDAVQHEEELRDHQPLGSGIIQIPALLDRLKGTDCHVTIEVNGWSGLQRSMAYLRELGYV